MRSIHSVAELGQFIETGPLRYAAQQIQHSFDPKVGQRWYEWLVRPHLAGVTTGDFITAVESMHFALDLDQRIVRDAIRWLDRQPITTRLTINVSSDSISNHLFTRYVASLLNESTVMPEQICFDLLVSDAIGDLSGASRFIRSMRDLGCAIALDSGVPGNPVLNLFGPMGHIDYFKIDQQWVRQAPVSGVHRATLESIAEFGRRLGIELIAVGVDGEPHLHLIRELGIDYYQGFVSGKPVLITEWGLDPDASESVA